MQAAIHEPEWVLPAGWLVGRMTRHPGARDAATVQRGSRGEADPRDGLGADVAHELANLMTVVLGSLEQLRRQPLDKQGRQQLARAERGPGRLAG